jgi:hypothetical protein
VIATENVSIESADEEWGDLELKNSPTQRNNEKQSIKGNNIFEEDVYDAPIQVLNFKDEKLKRP